MSAMAESNTPSEPEEVMARTDLTPREKAVRIAEWFAYDACEFGKRHGWVMRYERRGNEFVIFTDGVPTNAVEITDAH